MTPCEKALGEFPWLKNFQRGWDAVLSKETLDAAHLDMQVLFFGEPEDQVPSDPKPTIRICPKCGVRMVGTRVAPCCLE